jgi:hypothetical protein
MISLPDRYQVHGTWLSVLLAKTLATTGSLHSSFSQSQLLHQSHLKHLPTVLAGYFQFSNATEFSHSIFGFQGSNCPTLLNLTLHISCPLNCCIPTPHNPFTSGTGHFHPQTNTKCVHLVFRFLGSKSTPHLFFQSLVPTTLTTTLTSPHMLLPPQPLAICTSKGYWVHALGICFWGSKFLHSLDHSIHSRFPPPPVHSLLMAPYIYPTLSHVLICSVLYIFESIITIIFTLRTQLGKPDTNRLYHHITKKHE